jgi:hypothetical protein
MVGVNVPENVGQRSMGLLSRRILSPSVGCLMGLAHPWDRSSLGLYRVLLA